ncbi:MAG: ABC transporter ATP-binding protein [Planctomycetota bacterium]
MPEVTFIMYDDTTTTTTTSASAAASAATGATSTERDTDHTSPSFDPSAMVRLEEVHFHYDPEPGASHAFGLAIDQLQIQRGQRIACIGPSGCGKTTLINLMTGILRPQRGQVVLNNHPMHDLSDTARRAVRISNVGMIFQSFELLDYLTAEQNILLPYSINPALRRDRAARDRARELATAMKIEHVLRRRPDRLSQGERQRVAICRAMIIDPPMVIGDEPTGNLDPATADRMLDLLFDQAAARGATLLMVTHNHAILDRFDEVIDMSPYARFEPVADRSISN